MTSVPEVIDPVVALVVCLRLCHFVVMMGELEIDASCVDIDRRVWQDCASHRGALNVPPGSAFTPGRVPFWLTRLGLLP